MSEFAELVDAHYQALFRFGMSLTRNVDRASDLVQETFCIWAAKTRICLIKAGSFHLR